MYNRMCMQGWSSMKSNDPLGPPNVDMQSNEESLTIISDPKLLGRHSTGSQVSATYPPGRSIYVNLPAPIGEQTAVKRQANVPKLIFGPREGIFWKKTIRSTWITERKNQVQTGGKKPKSICLGYCPASLEN